MSGLKAKLVRLIQAHGPISIAHYVQMALTDPEFGYYMRRDPLGRDFITAPEISQMFGEMIGLFLVQAWEDRGRPSEFDLVELGPGRGTLMKDALRAAKIRPSFLEAAQVRCVEASPVLRTVQAQSLHGMNTLWHNDLHDIPGGKPLFLIANEFFDALPVYQFIRSRQGWHERMIGVREDELVYAAAPSLTSPDIIPEDLRNAPEGSIYEASAASQALANEIGKRVAQTNGVAILIDYGHVEPKLGDTLQAVKANRFSHPLREPGEADVTTHVDFAALGIAAKDAGARVSGPVTQGAFLQSLGILQRADRLKSSAVPQGTFIDLAIDRLLSEAHMGTLFKAMALSAPGSPNLPGFPC